MTHLQKRASRIASGLLSGTSLALMLNVLLPQTAFADAFPTCCASDYGNGGSTTTCVSNTCCLSHDYNFQTYCCGVIIGC